MAFMFRARETGYAKRNHTGKDLVDDFEGFDRGFRWTIFDRLDTSSICSHVDGNMDGDTCAVHASVWDVIVSAFFGGSSRPVSMNVNRTVRLDLWTSRYVPFN